MVKMPGFNFRVLVLIWIIVFTVSTFAEDASGNSKSIQKEIESLKLQDFGSSKDSVSEPRFNYLAGNDRGLQAGCQTKTQSSQKLGGLQLQPVSEAQKVWAVAKQELIDQLAEQIRDDEAAVRDESAASNSVLKCVQSANAAELEARQQAKLVNMISKNSNDLIDHIDRVEKVADEDEASTDDRLTKLKEKLQGLRVRATKAQADLVAIHECGKIKPLTRLRRREQQNALAKFLRQKRQTPQVGVVKKMMPVVRKSRMPVGYQDGNGAPIVRKWHAFHKREEDIEQAQAQMGEVDALLAGNAGGRSQAIASDTQRAWAEAQQVLVDQLHEQIQDKEAAITEIEKRDNEKVKNGGGYAPQMASDAHAAWAEAQQVLVDQLNEQIRDEETAVVDESAAVNSERRCVQSATAAGLEARQQAKIIGLLTKNSKDLIDNLYNVERSAAEDVTSSEERVERFKAKLESLRTRITAAQEELVAIHECGRVLPLNRLRRRKQFPAVGREADKQKRSEKMRVIV